MKLIENTKDLQNLCQKLGSSDYIAIDTEFIREKTYYPQLCLIQVAGKDVQAAIDPLSKDIDLSPFVKILAQKDICKVLHGCRQDLEIFLNEFGALPNNIFDTQVAAMVCGLGESTSYAALVAHYTKGKIDKSQRFTDWAMRPLKEKQLAYAMDDVIYLYEIYPQMLLELEKEGRKDWVKEEMAELSDPENFFVRPKEAWLRIKTKFNKPAFLAVLKEVAAWREQEAMDMNYPRNWVMRDDALIDLSLNPPKDLKDMDSKRSIKKGFIEKERAKDLMKAIQKGLKCPPKKQPVKNISTTYPAYISPTVELLKVLLKKRSESSRVAPRLIATLDELNQLAYDEKPTIRAIKGWRYDIFGKEAMALKKGELAFTLTPKGRIKIITIKDSHIVKSV